MANRVLCVSDAWAAWQCYRPAGGHGGDMTTFVISDPHFHHANMVQGGKIAIRPFSTVEDMNDHIVGRWNDTVKGRDKVYVLGDITLSRGARTGALDIVRQLRGHKRLVLGNHDHFELECYREVGFEKIFAMRELGGAILTHVPVHPSQVGPGARYLGNIHGHVHLASVREGPDRQPPDSRWHPDPRYFNACIEPLNYTPIPLDVILDHWRDQ